MGLLLLYLYFVAHSLVSFVQLQRRYRKTGSFFSSQNAYPVYTELHCFIIIWIFLALYSYSALLLQKLKLKGIPEWSFFVLVNFTQTLPFLLGLYLTVVIKASSLFKIFTCLQIIIHYFKINSYTLVNRDLRELFLKDPNSSPYPQNLTFKNFSYFLIAPTFCYEPLYPRRGGRRPLYAIQKLLFTISMMAMLYITLTQLVPLTIEEYYKRGSIGAYCQTLFAMKIVHCLGLWIAFDGLCNFYAELCDFGDRQFYQDFWNSSDQIEYNRKWNRVVHEYLYRHLFLELRNNQYSIPFASAIVFTYSSLLHEVIVLHIFGQNASYFYIFSMMMGQVMIIQFVPYMRGKYGGNLFFWFGQLAGENFFVYLYLYDMSNYKFN